MYRGTSGTTGTNATLLCQKMPFLGAKKAFLSDFYIIIQAKKHVFSSKCN